LSWTTNKLGDICDIARGGSPRPIDKFITENKDGINWIKIGDATRSKKYIYETKEKIKKEGISRSRFVNDGDFLLSNSMSFGRPYIMRTTGCIHDGWLVLSNYQKKLDINFGN
jgi:type I restriction enzyme S subunit